MSAIGFVGRSVRGRRFAGRLLAAGRLRRVGRSNPSREAECGRLTSMEEYWGPDQWLRAAMVGASHTGAAPLLLLLERADGTQRRGR
jgi:hypothetical protein